MKTSKAYQNSVSECDSDYDLLSKPRPDMTKTYTTQRGPHTPEREVQPNANTSILMQFNLMRTLMKLGFEGLEFYYLDVKSPVYRIGRYDAKQIEVAYNAAFDAQLKDMLSE